MAEESGLKPWEKTPGNRRLDHPDFRSVYETTYAKGTIKEFQVLQTNPIKVASMVKVEVDGQLYDKFIPLFYAPKAGYWDTEGVSATEFDPNQGYFKQAWMSFRCGDEVVILMQPDTTGKPTPKYVVGFADNYPRIGENIFKIDSWYFGVYKEVMEETEELASPDGKRNLCLLTKAYKDVIEGGHYNIQRWSVWGGYCGTLPFFYITMPPDNEQYKVCLFEVYNSPTIHYVNGLSVAFQYTYMDIIFKLVRHIFVVGPLLCVIYSLWWYENDVQTGTEIYQRTDDIYNYCQNPYYYHHYNGKVNGPPPGEVAATDVTQKAVHQWQLVDIKMKYGLYTPEKYEAVKNLNIDMQTVVDRGWGTEESAFGMPREDVNWTPEDRLLLANDPWYLNALYGYVNTTEPENLEIWVRPHTTKELIETGLLREDGSLPIEI